MKYEIKTMYTPVIQANHNFCIAKIMEDGTVYEIENTIINGAYRCSFNTSTSAKETYDQFGSIAHIDLWNEAMDILIAQIGELSEDIHRTGEDGKNKG